MPRPRALIATAVPLEYDSVLAHLDNVRTEQVGGHPYTIGDFQFNGTTWNILVLQTGAGNPEAAATTSKAIALWNPILAMFSGIAGGLKDVQKGDLCVPAQVHLYESGKALSGSEFLARAKTHLPSSSLFALSQSHAVTTNWQKRVKVTAPDGKQKVVYGPIVAGEKVLAAMDSETVKFVQKNYSHAHAVDMEAYGFLSAVYQFEPLKGLVIRCISDCCGDKGAKNDQYQPIAAGYASAFAFEILAHQADPNQSVPKPPIPPPDAPVSPATGLTDFSPLIPASLPPESVTSPQLAPEIEAAKLLIKEGKFEAAERSLVDLKKRAPTEFPEAATKVASLLARCHLYKGNLQLAREEYREILASDESDPNIWANAAQVATFLNDGPEALRLATKAREIAPADGFAASIYLFALHLSNRQDLIDATLVKEPWLLKNADCLFVLAGNEFENQKFGQAEKFIDQAIEIGPRTPQALVLKAQIIFKSIQAAIMQDIPLYGTMSSPYKERAQAAEAILTEAIDQLRNQDFRDELIKAYLSRSGIRAMLQDKDGCLNDCTEVLLLEPDQPLGLVNMSFALIGKDAYATAANYLERAIVHFGSRIALHLGIAYLKSNQLQKAVQILQPVYDASQGKSIEVAVALIEARGRLGNAIAVQDMVATLFKESPGNPDIYYYVALQEKREGKFNEAKVLLRKGIEFAAGERRRWLVEELANIHNLLLEFAESAALYKSIASQDDDTPETRQLVAALTNAGQYDEALKLAAMLRAKSGPIPVISEIEATILAETKDDLRAARDVLRALVEVDPNKQWHYLNIAKLSIYLNEPGAAEEALTLVNRAELTEAMKTSVTELETNLRRLGK